MGASSSSSTGWFMKISRAEVHRPRMSDSLRLTCLPGREPRTSSSWAMMLSTLRGSFDDDEATAAIGVRLRGHAHSLPASSFHADLSCEFHAARARKRNTPRTRMLALMRAASVVPFSKHSIHTCLQTEYILCTIVVVAPQKFQLYTMSFDRALGIGAGP